MDHSSSSRRRQDVDQQHRRRRDFSNSSFERTSSNIQLSPEREFRPSLRDIKISDNDFEVFYGEEPVAVLPAGTDAPDVAASYDTRTTSLRTPSRLSDEYISEKNTPKIPSFVEAIENDGGKAEQVEEAGLSWTVTLPTNNEQSMLYTNLTESNSVWKVEKSYDKKIGTTSLESIYSIKYSISEMGQGKVTIFCPQGPLRDDENLAVVQAKWLHVQRSSMSVKVLEKLVMDCPIINADIRRVAILLLEAVERSFFRESENGAYIEPGSVLRYAGTRHTPHDSHSFVATEPVVFVAFPFVELASSRNNHGSHERDEYYPRTLLQNLYGFDVVTSQGKHQVIHKMPVGSQPNDTLFVNQLWCLVIGSDILITMSDRPAYDMLGDTIEKRTDYFRQPLRIEIVDIDGFQHSMSISSKTTWVDFFRHVIFTVHGNLISIMDYELVDRADEVVTAERWVELAKATRPSLLKFYLVERKTPVSRSSSVSSRRSSRSGIKRLLLLDYARRDHRRNSKSSILRHHDGRHDEDSSSSERKAVSKRAATPGRARYPRSPTDTQWYDEPTEEKYQRPRGQTDSYSETNNPVFYPPSAATIKTIDSSDESYSEADGTSPSKRDSPDVDNAYKDAKDSIEDETSPYNVFTPSEHRRPSSSGNVYDDIRHAWSPTRYDHSSINKEQPPASDFEERGEDITSLEDNFSYLHDDDKNETSKENTVDVLLSEDGISSTKNFGIQMGDEGASKYIETSATQSKKPATAYQKVQVEDGSESSEEDNVDVYAYLGLARATAADTTTELNVADDAMLKDENDNSHPIISTELENRENAPEKRDILRNSAVFPQGVSHDGVYSRSRSVSSSTDDSFHSRGRSRTRRQRPWRWDSPGLFHNSSSSPPGVRFHPQERNSSDKDNLEMSPYGSSNATKVDALPIQTAVPFFFWRQTSISSTFSSHDTPEQILIKLLDQIDERISDDPISKYYSKVPELTMDDVLMRQESLYEAGLEKGSNIGQDESSQSNKLGVPGTIDLRTTSIFTLHSAENQAEAMNKLGDKNNVESVEALSTNLAHQANDQMKKQDQLLWEESQREHDSECTYIIRNFSSQVKKSHVQRRKPASGKIHYLVCGDCKAAKPYQSAKDALDHLHEKHIDCQHNNSERPYDDPCYVWLHRIWHDGYPMRSSRDGLLGIMGDFIEELSYICNYVRELHNMTTRDSSTGDAAPTPPLSVSITHSFQQIVKMFVFRSKQLSLINRRRSLVGGSSLENFPLVQRIDRKIDELLSLEMDANERIIDLLENAKKDIFLSGIGSHSEMLEAETVRVQFLALAFISGIQRPLLQPSFTGRSYVKDTLLQLYKDYTSRLHFQANNRPRKRVFLDIHSLEEELQALDKLVDSQESCLYNVLTLIDPLTSRYTTETRVREFRAEVQYGNVQLHQLIERRREIDNLATRLWILKDQVKQTIEIMEEDHGKAIRVFTVVTLFFLPLSFVSSFLGMNTADVRNSEWNQQIFWVTGIPMTIAVLSLAFIYGYKGEEIRDWMLQDRGHQYSSSTFHDMNSQISLEARWKEWNPAATAKQNITERRAFGSLIRSKIKNTSGWKRNSNESFKGPDGSDGRHLIRRRNTEDSLAPMRRS
ncbi:uncharacterized protein TRIVIDRAFT_196917 [Trichoderma virens Gv29-8]|uniref:Mg2+ transporter protein, CorA-like/Zinc transport protein ZntB n=1 Tax=Hypocrea virens (strain Gv29-8 / FGSC 10586) TaxID=413071 RepID=G9MF71_HYPVG|nr:uncharacterized protein TRIVIDRAFT_196917 [Trichoderma virens Gv29-8]EHK27037.1 hypothetical protein TRIVIDRAFT_196917 [Trichoderma virens Gv29-8]